MRVVLENELAEDRAASSNNDEDAIEERNPEDWIWMDQPFWDFEHAAMHKADGERDDEAEEDEDEDDGFGSLGKLHEKYEKNVVATKIWGKPAAEHQDHKLKTMWDLWQQLCELRVHEDYCNPDDFDMHIYTDFEGYDIVALIELRVGREPAWWVASILNDV